MDGFIFLACFFGFLETKMYCVSLEDLGGKAMMLFNQPFHRRIAGDDDEYERGDESLREVMLHSTPQFVISFEPLSFFILKLTQTQTFGAPPYNFLSTEVDSTNFATLADESGTCNVRAVE